MIYLITIILIFSAGCVGTDTLTESSKKNEISHNTAASLTTARELKFTNGNVSHFAFKGETKTYNQMRDLLSEYMVRESNGIITLAIFSEGKFDGFSILALMKEIEKEKKVQDIPIALIRDFEKNGKSLIITILFKLSDVKIDGPPPPPPIPPIPPSEAQEDNTKKE